MSDLVNVMRGRYTYEAGRFIPDRGMTEIDARLRALKLLADIGPGTPSFYLDLADGSYWQFTDFEDYSKELKQVDRKYILADYPTVDPDRPIE